MGYVFCTIEFNTEITSLSASDIAVSSGKVSTLTDCGDGKFLLEVPAPVGSGTVEVTIPTKN